MSCGKQEGKKEDQPSQQREQSVHSRGGEEACGALGRMLGEVGASGAKI